MTITNRPLRVFLCHSSDDKPAVRELYKKLRTTTWIQPWLDEEDIYPGQDWNLEIEKAIEDTDVIIVFLSNNSITKEGYVQREIRIALDYSDFKPEGTLFIIPVRLEECRPPKRLARWHYADYFEGQRDRAFQRVLVSVRKRAEALGINIDIVDKISSPKIENFSDQSIKLEKTKDVQVFITGNITESIINIGNDNKNILSKDDNGNTDYRQSVTNAYTYLDAVKIEFDRENAIFARKSLENVKDIITALGDENLSLEHEILECRCIQKFEKFDEAREKYENIAKRYPQDPRPFLYLAEICLGEDDLDGNSKFLEKAEAIDGNFWLLKLQQILRKQHLGEKIDIESIDEKTFPDNPRIKSNFYRLYGLLLENSGDQTNADSFLAKAIHLNPDRFSAYLDELSFVERRMFISQEETEKLQLSQVLLDGIENIANRFAVYGDIGARNKLYLSTKKLNALVVQENAYEIENVSKDIFRFATACYFDRSIENIVARVFNRVSLPDNQLNQLLDYLKASNKTISDDLSEVLICQFIWRNTLYNDGKAFFRETDNQKYLQFIDDLQSENHDLVLGFLENRVPFALALVNTPEVPLGLRKKIIENLPDDKTIQKDKIELLLKFDEKDFDEAFQILKQLDLSSLSYFECMPMLQVARQKGAWDFEIIILEKLLEKERNKRYIFTLKAQLFNAYINSAKFADAIDVGEQLLQEDASENFYNPRKQDILLSNTIYACTERGKIDNGAFVRAKSIIEWYQLKSPSFEFKAGAEAEVFLGLGDAENALKSVVDGVKIKKILSSQEYAKLYFLFVRIGNQLKSLNTDSLEVVDENTFVKLSDKDQCYFIGGDFELDALPISKASTKYLELLNKRVGDIVAFKNQKKVDIYKGEVERVFSLEKYILWRVIESFQSLAKDGELDGVAMIEIPQKDGDIDLGNIIAFFEESRTNTEPFFDLYCNNNYPLAMLAVSEGNLVNAIGRIQNENRGYIHFSLGTNDERENQIYIAKKILDEKKSFYIDGTSALVLSETGLLQKIYTHLPNLKVPQSVIVLFAEIADRFRYIPGQTGHTMGYARGKIRISSIEEDKRNSIQANLSEVVKLFEENPKNIGVISSANKLDCFSEMRVPDELCDACILAQKENIPVLTEDHLYLKLNELETEKKAPEYFSSWALIRVLYEEGHLTFDEYLDYFGYLSSYRFRFLPVNTEDIEKAVFGDRETKFIKPENIRRFNFPLVLSEEYGVPFDMAFQVVGIFLLKFIRDDSITSDVLEKIFTELLNGFPTNKNKKELGFMLLDPCTKAIEGRMPIPFCKLEDRLKYQKINNLRQVAESYIVELTPLSAN